MDMKLKMEIKLTKQKILIYCGSGYVFDEIYGPIIESFRGQAAIHLLMADFYLAPRNMDSLERLKTEGKISDYQIVQPYPRNKSAYESHRNIRDILHSLDHRRYDLLLLGSDFYVFDRYLITFARSKGATVVILSTGTMWRVLREHTEGKNHNVKGILRKLFDFGTSWYGAFDSFINYYLFPFIFSGRIFPRNIYDRFAFASNRADSVICFDPLEKEALRKVIPAMKNIFLAKHPASGLCKCGAASQNRAGKKILAAFAGNLAGEPRTDRFNRWVDIIKRALKLIDAGEVHLRLHPRTSNNLTWPHRLLQELQRSGFKVEIIKPLEKSLVDSVCEYEGVIGAPSGSLRVARAVCDRIFVVGVPNNSDGGLDDQKWILGNGEGIRWLEGNEDLGPEHLKAGRKKQNDRLAVTDLLKARLSKLSEAVN